MTTKELVKEVDDVTSTALANALDREEGRA